MHFFEAPPESNYIGPYLFLFDGSFDNWITIKWLNYHISLIKDVIESPNKSQYWWFRKEVTFNPKNRKQSSFPQFFCNGGSAQCLVTPQPFDDISIAPYCNSVPCFKSEVVFLVGTVCIKRAVFCKYAHTLNRVIFLRNVFNIRCRHSNHEISMWSINNWDSETL